MRVLKRRAFSTTDLTDDDRREVKITNRICLVSPALIIIIVSSSVEIYISRARGTRFTCEHMRQKEEKQQRDLSTMCDDERRTKCGGGSATGFRIVHLENFSSLHSTSFLVFFLVRSRTARRRR